MQEEQRETGDAPTLVLKKNAVSVWRVLGLGLAPVFASCHLHANRSLLETDMSVSLESARMLTDRSLVHLNWLTCQTRRLLLVEDLVDSLKVRFRQNLGWF